VDIYKYFAQNFVLPALAAALAGVVLAILGGTLKWSLKKHLAITVPLVVVAFIVSWSVTQHRDPSLVLAGTIVNESGEPVGQATISLDGVSERYLSEDDGNFRLDLTGKVKASERARVRVAKSGYSTFDGTAEVPSEGFIVRLHHL
jgi:hypothetical protein